MIRVRDLTPEVYYDHSRDFQLLGRLYELIFNYIKTNSDTIYYIPSASSINSEELELLAYTLGFKSKHDYPINQLRAVCGSISQILKNKGTLISVEQALKALLRAEEIKDNPTVLKDRDDLGNPLPSIKIYIPEKLTDINLFKDLLEYILPAGITYSIVNNSLLTTTGETDVRTAMHLKNLANNKLQPIETQVSSSISKYSDPFNIGLSDTGPGRIDNTLIVTTWENKENE